MLYNFLEHFQSGGAPSVFSLPLQQVNIEPAQIQPYRQSNPIDFRLANDVINSIFTRQAAKKAAQQNQDLLDLRNRELDFRISKQDDDFITNLTKGIAGSVSGAASSSRKAGGTAAEAMFSQSPIYQQAEQKRLDAVNQARAEVAEVSKIKDRATKLKRIGEIEKKLQANLRQNPDYFLLQDAAEKFAITSKKYAEKIDDYDAEEYFNHVTQLGNILQKEELTDDDRRKLYFSPTVYDSEGYKNSRKSALDLYSNGIVTETQEINNGILTNTQTKTFADPERAALLEAAGILEDTEKLAYWKKTHKNLPLQGLKENMTLEDGTVVLSDANIIARTLVDDYRRIQQVQGVRTQDLTNQIVGSKGKGAGGRDDQESIGTNAEVAEDTFGSKKYAPFIGQLREKGIDPNSKDALELFNKLEDRVKLDDKEFTGVKGSKSGTEAVPPGATTLAGQTTLDDIKAFAEDPNNPNVAYAVYNGNDVLVLPYTGEKGLPDFLFEEDELGGKKPLYTVLETGLNGQEGFTGFADSVEDRFQGKLKMPKNPNAEYAILKLDSKFKSKGKEATGDSRIFKQEGRPATRIKDVPEQYKDSKYINIINHEGEFNPGQRSRVPIKGGGTEPSWGLFQFNIKGELPGFLDYVSKKAPEFGKPTKDPDVLDEWFEEHAPNEYFSELQEAYFEENIAQPSFRQLADAGYGMYVSDPNIAEMVAGTRNQMPTEYRNILKAMPKGLSKTDFINKFYDMRTEKAEKNLSAEVFPGVKKRYDAERSLYLEGVKDSATNPIQTTTTISPFLKAAQDSLATRRQQNRIPTGN